MFDVGKFGSSFCGGPLNGFDAMVMSEVEKRKSKPSKSEINAMAYFLVSNYYINPHEVKNYSDDEIVEMYKYYR